MNYIQANSSMQTRETKWFTEERTSAHQSCSTVPQSSPPEKSWWAMQPGSAISSRQPVRWQNGAGRQKFTQTILEHEWDKAILEEVLRETFFVWTSWAPCITKILLWGRTTTFLERNLYLSISQRTEKITYLDVSIKSIPFVAVASTHQDFSSKVFQRYECK